jgi:hypothetical protein
MLRSVRFPSSRVLRSALLEDPESIQASLMEVVNGLLRGTLELKRGELILRALNTAVRNIRRVRFDLHQDEMIREIPNYPDQPQTGIDDPSEPSAIRRRPTREEIARFREADLAAYFGGPDKVPAAYKPAPPANAPANGTAPKPASTPVATDAFPPASVKREARNLKAELANVRSESQSLITQSLKERKNAAHRASGA